MAIDSANALTTLADAKVWCGIKSADTTYDSIIENMVDSVSWQFNRFCDRHLKTRTLTAYIDGDETDTMLMPEYPITSITSIHIDSERTYGDDTLVDPDTYSYYDDGRIVLDENTFSKWPQANKIVYVAGYVTLPYDLVQAAKDQIKWLFRRWRTNSEGVNVNSTINGDTTMTEAGEMLTSSLEILKRYKKAGHVRPGRS